MITMESLDNQRVLDAYLVWLCPEWDEDCLQMESISRKPEYREELEARWPQLSPEQQAQVRAADQVLLAHAAEIGPWYVGDMIDDDREALAIPHEHWWYWLDEIAAGAYPPEYLPEGGHE